MLWRSSFVMTMMMMGGRGGGRSDFSCDYWVWCWIYIVYVIKYWHRVYIARTHHHIKHKIYPFYMHWWLISQRWSHSAIQFIVERSSEKQTKLLVNVYRYCSLKLTFSISTNELVCFILTSMENMILEDPIWYHFPLWIGIFPPYHTLSMSEE